MDFRIRDKKLWTDNNNIENAKLVSSKRAKSKRGRGTRGRAGRKPQLVLSYVEKDGLGGGRWAEGGRNKKSGEAIAIPQVRDDRELDQDGGGRRRENWSDSGYNLR